VGDKTFSSREKAKAVCRRIIQSYRNGETVKGDDDLFLRDLVDLHPDASQKIGGGIDHFTVANNPVWHKYKHFVIIRENGTSTDFSFTSCIDGSSRRRDILGALRGAVSDQIIEFKRKQFSLVGTAKCPITGAVLTPHNCHVDHKQPNTFLSLVTRWIAAEAIQLGDIRISDSVDNQFVSVMADPAQNDSWRLFHRRNAVLRIISPKANLSMSKGARP